MLRPTTSAISSTGAGCALTCAVLFGVGKLILKETAQGFMLLAVAVCWLAPLSTGTCRAEDGRSPSKEGYREIIEFICHTSSGRLRSSTCSVHQHGSFLKTTRRGRLHGNERRAL